MHLILSVDNQHCICQLGRRASSGFGDLQNGLFDCCRRRDFSLPSGSLLEHQGHKHSTYFDARSNATTISLCKRHPQSTVSYSIMASADGTPAVLGSQSKPNWKKRPSLPGLCQHSSNRFLYLFLQVAILSSIGRSSARGYHFNSSSARQISEQNIHSIISILPFQTCFEIWLTQPSLN